MVTDKEDLINTLQANIKKLVSLYESEKVSGNALKKINSDLLEKIKLKDEELEKLEAKCNNLKIARSVSTKGDDIQQAKMKVNSLVREIDKCIALLNR
jgi:hypothetical protein